VAIASTHHRAKPLSVSILRPYILLGYFSSSIIALRW